MPRPIRAIIDPAAVADNLAAIKRLAPRSRAWAVVKANAYGHGIARIFGALRHADGIAVLDLDEAVLVRELGWTRPILLLEGFFDVSDLDIVSRLRLTTTVHCEDQLRMIESAQLQDPIAIYLKMNTGMNRLGFAPDAYRRQWERARSMASISSIVHMTHLADADRPEGAADQLEIFNVVRAGLPGETSVANSAACLWHPESHADWVRPGIALYGASPSGVSADIEGSGLTASMSLHSEVISVQNLSAGDAVGYGARFTARGAMRVGIVACGYADGYPRVARGWGRHAAPALVGGIRTTLVGRVSMDMLAVDLSPCPDAKLGSPVELWGRNLPIDEVARAADTIGYELMCGLAPRVPVETMAPE